MKKQEADKLISSCIKKLFDFAMSRLSKIDEAEEITLQVYESLLKQDNIDNPDGYIYRIARNVYARYIDDRKQITAVDGFEYVPDSRDFTKEIIESERKWFEYIPEVAEEIKELSRQYVAEAEKAELIGQPEHIYELIKC